MVLDVLFVSYQKVINIKIKGIYYIFNIYINTIEIFFIQFNICSKGEEYELLFDAPISITLDNAQSTKAFLNGLEIDLSENVNKYNSSTLVINDG